MWLRPIRIAVTGRRTALERLGEGVRAARTEQECLSWQVADDSTLDVSEESRLSSLALRQGYLDQAIDAYADGDPDRGWGMLHRVRETDILLMSHDRVQSVAVTLLAECDDAEFTPWRREAIEDLLGALECFSVPAPSGRVPKPGRRHRAPARGPSGPVTEPSEPASPAGPATSGPGAPGQAARSAVPTAECWARDRERVRQATVLRNGHFSDTYNTLSVTSYRLLSLMVLGTFALAAAAVLLWRQSSLDPPLLPGAEPSSVVAKEGIPLLALMMAMGALGAVVSAVQRLARQPIRAATPAHLGTFVPTLSRLLIGALAGLTVHLAALGGLAIPARHPVPLLLLAALTAGLTERLLVYQPTQKQDRT